MYGIYHLTGHKSDMSLFKAAETDLDLRLRALRYCTMINRGAAAWSSAEILMFGLSGVQSQL
jgi:hypothetical protein